MNHCTDQPSGNMRCTDSEKYRVDEKRGRSCFLTVAARGGRLRMNQNAYCRFYPRDWFVKAFKWADYFARSFRAFSYLVYGSATSRDREGAGPHKEEYRSPSRRAVHKTRKCSRPVACRMGLVWVAVVSTILAGTHAQAVTPAVLIDSGLQRSRVSIHSISKDSISYFDADRRLQTDPLSRFVQVREIGVPQNPRAVEADPPPTDHSDEPRGVIELVDGQRLVGEWVGSDPETQALRWRHPSLGEFSVSLENLRVVLRSGTPAQQDAPAESDWVELANGDKLLGFVTRIVPAGLELQIQGHEQTVILPIDQIQAVGLANPRQHPLSRYAMVWLADGSRILVDSLLVASDRLSMVMALKPSGAAVSLPMKQAIRIDMPSLKGRLIDLASLPMRVIRGGVVFGLDMGPRVEGVSILMHAPVAIGYELPVGAIRFAAVAELIAPTGGGADRGWGDLELMISVDGGELSRSRLNTAQPGVRLYGVLDGKVLTIELDPGYNGPVWDRLLLRDAVIYTRTGPDPLDE